MDLFHPHCDPNDRFDIASLYAIDEIEIKAIILDKNNKHGKDQNTSPGSVPVSQLNYITLHNWTPLPIWGIICRVFEEVSHEKSSDIHIFYPAFQPLIACVASPQKLIQF